jgi:hypothetical protein
MKRATFIGSATLCAAILCHADPAYAATCAPPELVHIVVAYITPGIPSTAFAAQPKVIYRIGSDRMRVEEAADPANGIHEVVVLAEPNIWMANLYDNTGKHIVDPAPSHLTKAPVFGIQGISAKFSALEVGCEADFIAENAPTPVRAEQVEDARLDVYRIEDGADAVEILERPGTGTPAIARYYHQGQLTKSVRYDLYATGLANDPSLFAPPSGVQYAEPSHL